VQWLHRNLVFNRMNMEGPTTEQWFEAVNLPIPGTLAADEKKEKLSNLTVESLRKVARKVKSEAEIVHPLPTQGGDEEKQELLDFVKLHGFIQKNEVRCKLVVWQLSDLDFGKGVCQAQLRVSLFWNPRQDLAQEIINVHDGHNKAESEGIKWNLRLDDDEGAHRQYFATYEYDEDEEPLRIEIPALSILHAEPNREKSEKRQVSSFVRTKATKIKKKTKLQKYCYVRVTQMIAATLDLTHTLPSGYMKDFPFDSHNISLTLQMRIGKFKGCKLRPATVEDNVNSLVYPFGYLDIPLESPEFKFRKQLEWKISKDKEKARHGSVQTRYQITFLIFIWRKHHYYVWNIVMLNAVVQLLAISQVVFAIGQVDILAGVMTLRLVSDDKVPKLQGDTLLQRCKASCLP
jgi:hypothetical protein